MKSYIFQDSQIIGSVIKQFSVNSVLNQGNLNSDEYDSILKSNPKLLNELLKEDYSLIKVEHPIIGKKTKNDLYYLQYSDADYQLIPSKEAKSELKYSIGAVYRKPLVGTYFIFNIEYRYDGIYYWICYPGLMKASANRRIHEDKMEEYNVNFDKVLLTKHLIVKKLDSKEDFVIQAIDNKSYDWTKKDVTIYGIDSKTQVKISKERLLIDYDVSNLNEELNNLKEIDVRLL